MFSLLKKIVAPALFAAMALPAAAFPVPVTLPDAPQAQITLVANGCGADFYRGPGGACHRYGNGPYPGGYYGPYGHSWPVDHGCGAGRYRGPWGSCHAFGTGPYPGGYYGPYYK